MIDGYVANISDFSSGAQSQVFFANGKPENRGWNANSLSIDETETYMLFSVRCSRCGFTELFSK